MATSLSPGTVAFRLAFQLSPIIFTGGITSFIPGGMLPIIAITQALNFFSGLLSGANIDVDDFFANFHPIPGGTLVDQQIGRYPFANQAVAANAVIRQPLQISMRMICPARDQSGYALKLATMTALKLAFDTHNASGGTYTIATPSFFYTDCVMTGMRDTSNAASMQAQNTYQLDFEKPLLTISDAVQAQGSLLSKITAGLPLSPVAGGIPWSGFPPTLGNPASLAAIGTLGAGQVAGLQAAAPASGFAGISAGIS